MTLRGRVGLGQICAASASRLHIGAGEAGGGAAIAQWRLAVAFEMLLSTRQARFWTRVCLVFGQHSDVLEIVHFEVG